MPSIDNLTRFGELASTEDLMEKRERGNWGVPKLHHWIGESCGKCGVAKLKAIEPCPYPVVDEPDSPHVERTNHDDDSSA